VKLFNSLLPKASHLWIIAQIQSKSSTAAVERGDIENTVLSEGLVQPIKYVDSYW